MANKPSTALIQPHSILNLESLQHRSHFLDRITDSLSTGSLTPSRNEVDPFFRTYLPHPANDHSKPINQQQHHQQALIKSSQPYFNAHLMVVNHPSINDHEGPTSSSSSSSSSVSSSASSLFLSSASNSPTSVPIRVGPPNIEPAPPPSQSSRFLLPGPAIKNQNLSSDSFIFYPPSNFGIVAPGIFRSSFPNRDNFEFLRSLGLKSVMTLVQEQYPAECLKFYQQEGIKFMQFSIPGNKEPFVHIPEDKIRLALKHVLDVRNHPMLIHCNKGKHRTGCLVGCLRKLQHWSSTAIFDEYRRYAFPKSRNMDQQFIELFDLAPVWDEIDPDFAPQWLDLSV
ncbi:hypothetical protein CROQUDRAFT_36019 [Cronartium quercuum f. sp. fusiforme G11]|uniref:diphosphoinositol-polyphosphate diphosphatase n=1 Tax=Cronartium quercuum f. sp. fusiforme G11 TaxID=708437 RepID=A0A9P6NTA0_9BASI|nr:hypothetical protein CROQUDRAFT_36019 [Cronartium quercuum f. sp. fusiforme G11]